MSYKRKLADPRWQKKRLEILKRDKWKCKLCKDTETELHVHHQYYTDGAEPWEYENKALVALCAHCHREVELAIKQYGRIPFSEMSVHKIDTWDDGSLSMFIQYDNYLIMRFYDKQNNFVEGYCLGAFEGLKKIRSMILKALKNG